MGVFGITGKIRAAVAGAGLALLAFFVAPSPAPAMGTDPGIPGDFIATIFQTDWFSAEEIRWMRQHRRDPTPPVAVPGETEPTGLRYNPLAERGVPCAGVSVISYGELLAIAQGKSLDFNFRWQFDKAGAVSFAQRLFIFGPLRWIYSRVIYIPNPEGSGVIDFENNIFFPEAVAEAVAVQPGYFSLYAEMLEGRTVTIITETHCDGYDILELEIR